MVTEEGSYIHVAWQLPQIVIRAAAEVMISIPFLEFVYTQIKYIFII